jgi:REP element-mobilizing transposase RayT
MRKLRQLDLSFVTSRRKVRRRAARSGVPHRVRPLHCHRHPVHITLRRAQLLPSLREQSLFLAIRGALSRTARSWFRVLHFSVQADHVHMIVEAGDKPSLCRGTTGLAVRVARAINRALGRRGAVWSGRYHARALGTPREVRNGLVYVLMNHRKHASVRLLARHAFDVCSSRGGSTGGPDHRIPGHRCPPTRLLSWLPRPGSRERGGSATASFGRKNRRRATIGRPDIPNSE